MVEAVTHTGYADGKGVPVRVVLGKDAYEITGAVIEEWKEWTEDSWRDDL